MQTGVELLVLLRAVAHLGVDSNSASKLFLCA